MRLPAAEAAAKWLEAAEMEKLDFRPVVGAATATAGVIYSACAALVLIFPGAAVGVSKNIFHGVEFEKSVNTSVTASSFFAGLLEVLAITAAIAAVFTLIYNLCVRRCKAR